jgi:aryl-alcohol dehydrogenase-like predicted oxidoreductase
MHIKGFATPSGTESYRKKFEGKTSPHHYKILSAPLPPLHLSSLGLGTYLGSPNDETDQHLANIVQKTIQNGLNVIDTAINYRFQRAERSIGKALNHILGKGNFKREEIVISTKGGFVPFDSDEPIDAFSYFQKTFIESGIAQFEEIVAGCHCISPAYIQNQINTSLINLGLNTVDIYYIHNPETQLAEISKAEFQKRMKALFETLEKNVADGKIKMYGTATWNGYRIHPKAKEFLNLEALVKLAQDVAGKDHHFKAIQLPYNLAMPEALLLQNQELEGEWVSILTAAQRLGLMVMASASLLQGRLSKELPQKVQDLFQDLETSAQKSIQFVRSTPGITTALVGMKSKDHFEENIKVLHFDLQPESVSKIFTST